MILCKRELSYLLYILINVINEEKCNDKRVALAIISFYLEDKSTLLYMCISIAFIFFHIAD